MKLRPNVTFILIAFFAMLSEARAEHRSHIVQPGDNIGKILHSLGFSPLWGPNGFVKKTIQLNAHKLDERGNVLRAQTILDLPIDHRRSISQESEQKFSHAPQTLREVDDPINVKAFATMGFQYWEINSVEREDKSKARIESKFTPSLVVGLDHIWSKTAETYYGLGYHIISFIEPSTKPIKSASENYAEFFIGQRFHLPSDWTISGKFSNTQKPFLRALTDASLKIETPWMQQVSIGLEKKFVTRKNGSFALKLTPYYVLGKELDGISIDPGIGARLNIRLTQVFEHFSSEGIFFADYSQQNSNITRQTTKQNGLLLKLNFPMGKN